MRRIPLVLVILLFLVLPVFFGDDRHHMNLLILCLIWTVVSASWDLILGYCRIFSFAQLAFFMIGGYTSAILSITLDVSPWITMPIGAVAAGMMGVLIGLPCLRLVGMYVGMVTFAIHLVLPTIIIWGQQVIYTGGTTGIIGIPAFHIAGYVFKRNVLTPWYYVALALCALFLFLIQRIIRSSYGEAFAALRDSELLAKCLGIYDYKYKLMVFGMSAFMAGMMGAFYGTYVGMLSPAVLDLEFFLMILAMIMLGGVGRFPGVVIGAFFVTIFNDYLIVSAVGPYRLLILGGLIVVVMIYTPEGFMTLPRVFKLDRLLHYISDKKTSGLLRKNRVRSQGRGLSETRE